MTATNGIHRILENPFKPPFPTGTEYIIVATGCFWGSEKAFWRMPGVYTTAVGYAGGHTKNPTYHQVCSGSTGHTEAVLVVWNPDMISLADITRMFLQSHNPTQVNGQGHDHGTQYRTAFYYHNDIQKRIGEAAIASYEKSLGKKIATEVKNVTIDKFVYAEDYHQQYLAAPGARKYCSAQPQEVDMVPNGDWLPKDLQEQFRPMLDEKFWEKHAPSPHCVLNDPHEQIKEW